MLCLRLAGPKTALVCLAVLLQLVLLIGATVARAEEEAVGLITRALSLAREGKLDEAIKVQERVIPAVQKMAGKRHPLYPMQIALLGDLYVMKQDYAAGERFHLEALRLREDLLGREHADVAASLAKLSDLYITTANYDKAETTLRRAISIRRKVLPSPIPITVSPT